MTTYLRRLHPATHANLPRKPLEDHPELSWRAVGILMYMLSRPETWELRRGDLVNRHKEGRDAVITACRELRDAGYVRNHPRPGGGTDWIVAETPLTDDEWVAALSKPDDRIPSTSDVPTTGFLGPQESGRLSTSEEKNNLLSLDLGDEARNGSAPAKANREDFERVWGLARTGSKKQAWEHYRRAVPKKTTAAALYSVRERYVAHAEREGFRPQALFRWIRDERWEEDLPDAEPSFADAEDARWQRLRAGGSSP